jgi:Na+/proline symporter
MHWVDWCFVVIPCIVVVYVALKAQKYVRSVSDFLTAGRVAGRYVVAVASGEAAMGLISLVAMFEMYYNSGFALNFWGTIVTPINLVLALTGYCIYRFRETRAMTMGQFFEMRYSKSFRIFAAILQSISGIINYAIFPAVGARFFIYYCDLPLKVQFMGMEFPTFALLMALFLGMAVLIVTLGGQITIMVTDCVQGILSYPLYLIVVGYILYKFSWFEQMGPTLLDRPSGKSMLNPYDISKLRDFNLFYIFVGIIGGILNRMSWSGTQGYNAAAATPHEQKMGQVLGTWRSGFSVMMYVLLAVVAYTFLHNEAFSVPSREVRVELASKAMADVAEGERFAKVRADAGEYLTTGVISPALQSRIDRVKREEAAEEAKKKLMDTEEVIETPIAIDSSEGVESKKLQETAAIVDTTNPQESMREVVYTALKSEDRGKAKTFDTIFSQMRVPVSLRKLLPVGITGIFCALMVFLMVSTDTTYMHSWGSIIVQDIVLPFRKKPFTPHQQLRLLRIIISGVAVFAFLFSLFFSQIDYILMFFAITGAIWLGGAGPCIVFGLYWKRGKTAGAYGALIGGSSLAVIAILLQQYWASHIYPFLANHNMVGSIRWFFETVSAPFHPYVVWTVTPDKFPINSQEIYFITMLVSVSLYVGLSLLSGGECFNMDRLLHRGKYRREGEELKKEKFTFKRFLGIDSQYTKGDRILAWSVFIYSFGWGFGSFLTLVVWNKLSPWPDSWWATWFFITNIVISGIIGVVSTVWFTIGGTWDLMRMFKRLEANEVNTLDDGRVIGHVSADEIELVGEVEAVDVSTSQGQKPLD